MPTDYNFPIHVSAEDGRIFGTFEQPTAFASCFKDPYPQPDTVDAYFEALREFWAQETR